MRTIGVRELKARASRILRDLQQRGQEVEITHRGRVVARLVPVTDRRDQNSAAAARAWSSLDRVAREIGARWPRGRSAAAAVREIRREL